MNKKVLLVSCLALMSHDAAGSGFSSYIGGAVGYGVGSNRVDSKYNFISTTNFKTPSGDLATNGFIGGIYAGAGMPYNNLYLGIEGGYNFADITGEDNRLADNGTAATENKLSLKMRHSFEASLKMGVKVNTFLPYLKVGVALSEWSLDSTFTIPHTEPGTRKFLFAFKPAIGLEAPITEKLTLGIEFSHALYQSLRLKQTVTKAVPNPTSTHTVKPRVGLFQVRLSYTL